MLDGSDGAAPQTFGLSKTVVANLVAINRGRPWTRMDDHGLEGVLYRTVWTSVDGCGRRSEIYGSGGRGFESLRACEGNPCVSQGFLLGAHVQIRLQPGRSAHN
jgi:hypothetical protein